QALRDNRVPSAPSTAHRLGGQRVPVKKAPGTKSQRELSAEDLNGIIRSKGSIAQTRRRLVRQDFPLLSVASSPKSGIFWLGIDGTVLFPRMCRAKLSLPGEALDFYEEAMVRDCNGFGRQRDDSGWRAGVESR